jgi:hypothetical protein
MMTLAFRVADGHANRRGQCAVKHTHSALVPAINTGRVRKDRRSKRPPGGGGKVGIGIIWGNASVTGGGPMRRLAPKQSWRSPEGRDTLECTRAQEYPPQQQNARQPTRTDRALPRCRAAGVDAESRVVLSETVTKPPVGIRAAPRSLLHALNLAQQACRLAFMSAKSVSDFDAVGAGSARKIDDRSEEIGSVGQGVFRVEQVPGP